MTGDWRDEWHVVVPPRAEPGSPEASPAPAPGSTAGTAPPVAPSPSPSSPYVVPGVAPRRRRRRPSPEFVFAVLLVVTGFGVLRTLTAHGSAPPDHTGPGLVLAGPQGGEYAFQRVHADGDPVRWNPCRPIRYVLNLASAPPGAAADVRGAMDRVSAVSGLEFVYDGTTTEVAGGSRSAYQPDRYGKRWAPLLISWQSLAAAGYEHGRDIVGVGGPDTVLVGQRRQIVSGLVVLDTSDQLPGGFADHRTWGAVLMHEIGHAIGLGHVDDYGEVMYGGGASRTQKAEWGPGDREGLRRLGRASGCLETPPAGPVRS